MVINRIVMLKLGSNVSDQKWGQYKYKGKMSRCHISDPKSDIRSKYYYWHQDKIWYDEWPTIICPLLLLLYYLDQFVENVQNNNVQWEHHRQDLPDPRSHNQQQPRQQRQQRWRVLTKICFKWKPASMTLCRIQQHHQDQDQHQDLPHTTHNSRSGNRDGEL